jgi:hypothetical protein
MKVATFDIQLEFAFSNIFANLGDNIHSSWVLPE